MRLGASLMLALLGTLVLAGSAAAFPFPAGALGGSGPEFALKAPGGYRLQVSREDAGHVSIAVSKGSASTTYTAPGKSADGRIDAGFGRFGRVAVAFEAAGKPQRTAPFPGCTGKPIVTQAGLFRGTIRFRGEGGFTRVAARSAHGAISTSPAWHCGGKPTKPGSKGKGGGAGEEESDDSAFLFAGCGNSVFFAGGGHSSSKPAPVFPDEREFTLFAASSSERAGPVSISRTIIAAGSGAAFSFDDALTTATASPPPPFHGKAVFSLDPAGKPLWTGALKAAFIGKDVAMSGPGFGARLFRDGSGFKGPPPAAGGSCAAAT
jgi:hypothetical protein